MKKQYRQPELSILVIGQQLMLTETSTDTIPAHNNDPQKPGNALSRRSDVWEDDEEDF